MKCQNCGSEVSDGVKYCPFCGGPIQIDAAESTAYGQGDDTYQSNAQNAYNYGNQGNYDGQNSYNNQNAYGQGGYNQQNSYGQGSYGTQNSYNGGYQNMGGNQYQQQTPMKWYKFIIYVQLILGALANVVNGLMCFTGAHYGIDIASYIYDYYGIGLKIADILMALASFALAALAIFTRRNLVRFKRNAPTMYFGYVALVAIVSLVYTILTSLITGTFLLDSSTVSSLVSSAALIALSFNYFKKREYMFVN